MSGDEHFGRRPYELVAHRAGNHVTEMHDVQGIADVVEVDVHLRRGRLEVRHGKILWPTSRLWERWYLLPRDHEVPVLEDILAAAGPDVHLWLDLKGVDPRLAKKVRPLPHRPCPLSISPDRQGAHRPDRARPRPLLTGGYGVTGTGDARIGSTRAAAVSGTVERLGQRER